uniref:Uncharacterized protein n=1 Tax=Rhizophora mucronata TaxID=61149 RepID=A0A2P2P753_RHIMU
MNLPPPLVLAAVSLSLSARTSDCSLASPLVIGIL